MLSFMNVVLLILVSHLRQWPLRTVLTIGGVALGVSASVAVRTANVDVLSSFEQAVLTVAGPTTLEVSGGESGLDEQLMTRLPYGALLHSETNVSCSLTMSSQPARPSMNVPRRCAEPVQPTSSS